MSSARRGPHPVLIEWSPGVVRAFDPVTRHSRHGATIRDCVDASQAGLDVVVCISQRSAFIRAIAVPHASRDEISKILGIRLAQMLPIRPEDCAFGFRLGDKLPGRSSRAIVGAMKLDSLRQVYSEASDSGLRLRAVVPIAFGSWLVAHAKSLDDCLVVSASAETVNADLIRKGELNYSRAFAVPDSPEELKGEIARTFEIAESPPVPVISAGSPEVDGDVVDAKEPIEYLADPHHIDRALMNLELPELQETRKAQREQLPIWRAGIAAVCAVLFGVYVFGYRLPAQKPISKLFDTSQRGKRATSLGQIADAKQESKILDAAFRPGQTFSDVLNVLGNSAPAGSWITEVTLARGRSLSMIGRAPNNEAVAGYVRTLSRNPRFESMRLVDSNEGAVGKKPAVQFAVSGKPVALLPFDKPPVGGSGT